MAGTRKGGGSRKGIPNKRTQEIQELLAEKYPGWNPVLALADMAKGDVSCSNCNGKGKITQRTGCPICIGTGKLNIPLDIKLAALKEVAQYVAPKRKAVELSGGLTKVVHVKDLTGEGE
jgi:RecJ-like exonuclease